MKLTLTNIKKMKTNSTPLQKRVINYIVDEWSNYDDIPLPAELMDDLKKYMDWFRIADDEFDNKLDEYYFSVNILREPEGVSSTAQWLAKFEAKHGLKKVSPHGLRHTYCSILLSQNVPIQTVSKYLGHSDSTITLEVYSHFIPDTQERVTDALSNLFND